MNLSCIIINYKNSGPLKDCLASIYQTVQEIDFEVIIVDNSDNDPGLQPLKELYPKAQFISNSSNVGFSKANNQAAKIAKGDVLIFLNPENLSFPVSKENGEITDQPYQTNMRFKRITIMTLKTS